MKNNMFHREIHYLGEGCKVLWGNLWQVKLRDGRVSGIQFEKDGEMRGKD